MKTTIISVVVVAFGLINKKIAIRNAIPNLSNQQYNKQ